MKLQVLSLIIIVAALVLISIFMDILSLWLLFVRFGFLCWGATQLEYRRCDDLSFKALYPQAVSLWHVPLFLVTRHTNNEPLFCLVTVSIRCTNLANKGSLSMWHVIREQRHTPQGNSLWMQGLRGLKLDPVSQCDKITSWCQRSSCLQVHHTIVDNIQIRVVVALYD